MLRPRPARWFEILAARDDATLVLEALARTGAVELEARSSIGLPAAFADVLPLLAQYADLAARYRAYWPPAEPASRPRFPRAPVAALQRSLAIVRAWASESEPVIQALQRGESERRELHLWQPLLETLGRRALDPGLLAGAGPWLGVRLFLLPPGGESDPAGPRRRRRARDAGLHTGGRRRDPPAGGRAARGAAGADAGGHGAEGQRARGAGLARGRCRAQPGAREPAPG